MQIAGKRLSTRQSRVVELKRFDESGQPIDGLMIRVSSIPLSLDTLYAEVNPKPRPPMIASKKDGETVQKEDWSNPVYQKQFADWMDLKQYYMLWWVMKDDQQVVFDAAPTDVKGLTLLREEFRVSGLTHGDLSVIMKAAEAASNITKEDIDAAKKGF